ncbi:unnamed protein product, partial [Brachionus calyciflorus]
YKSRIYDHKKISHYQVQIFWTNPLGLVDDKVLTCISPNEQIDLVLNKNDTSGECSFGSLIFILEIYLTINLGDSSSESEKYFAIIEPDPVQEIKLLKSTSFSFEVLWIPPNDYFDQFLVILKKNNVTIFQEYFSNMTLSHEFKNLDPDTNYLFEIYTYRNGIGKIKSIELTTQNNNSETTEETEYELISLVSTSSYAS